ncbi:MAG: helix-turn-helix domain-containing protein, partial [Alphaproteobacteria bacterium]
GKKAQERVAEAAAKEEEAAAAAAEAEAPAEEPAEEADEELGEQAGTTHLVGRTVAEVERDLILDTLQHCLGNRTRAANILGISIRTLRNKLKQYNEEGAAVPTPSNLDTARI